VQLLDVVQLPKLRGEAEVICPYCGLSCLTADCEPDSIKITTDWRGRRWHQACKEKFEADQKFNQRRKRKLR
jgi:hypothetical protein